MSVEAGTIAVAGERATQASRLNVAGMGLRMLFAAARGAPWVLRWMRPLGVRLGVWCSRAVRENTALNARRILGGELSPAELKSFAYGGMGSFYDFVIDVGRSARVTREHLLARIESVEGEERYYARRRRGGGAVLVTAHMGAFEVGLAALRRAEKRVHVVFKRDEYAAFEELRSRVRAMLDVDEAPIDDGFASLVRLRDALLADEVVVMQGDRAMAGQKSQEVTICGGTLRIPVGPVKLARLTGSPVVPVFLVRGERGGFRVYLCEPIEVAAMEEGEIDPAVVAVGKAIEKFVRAYPQQWLVLERAFVEDVS